VLEIKAINLVFFFDKWIVTQLQNLLFSLLID
jgi:hypothetical protein